MTEPDPAWFEREYNPRVLVPDAAEISAVWAARAAETRRRHPPLADIHYGDHPREALDLFRAADARGTILFIHGGYWRALSKAEFSWVAGGFLEQNLSVAMLNYPLCPDVGLARIVAATRAAFAHLYTQILTERERSRIVVTGHSAGGYLTALHLATDWAAQGLPADPVAGAVPISGVFDLAPLVHTSMNEALRLDATLAASLSLHTAPLRSRAELAFVVGGAETAEFHRQSAAMADHWSELGPPLIDLAGCNHFDVIEGLAEAGSELNQLVAGMIEG